MCVGLSGVAGQKTDTVDPGFGCTPNAENGTLWRRQLPARTARWPRWSYQSPAGRHNETTAFAPPARACVTAWSGRHGDHCAGAFQIAVRLPLVASAAAMVRARVSGEYGLRMSVKPSAVATAALSL